ncbi:BAG family molecular chaperone regulator 1-like isoform X2 [Carica papaya]|nr:BAG family molecular chaperone regulator 1-like isoform X2 [Carica papaya]XP_021895348.1 BAG family molecular chaperone regulator 1-like isoform X2 [Carica papaya]XP_021895349.1 BAG family molecular chaperone regulator 1-like isoform X2 [Carica papaya]
MEAKKSSVGYSNAEHLEVRPGGMLVQKRGSDSRLPVPTIKVKVKYGSQSRHISISSQASFGELKKMLAEHTGIHHEEQKLIYKKKERDSKSYLDVAGVKDGSKLLLVEDIAIREKRCLEKLKNANIEKTSKSLTNISSEVDKFAQQVTALEATASKGRKVSEVDVDNLTGILMTILVKLDELIVEGDLKLQKRTQEKRVQKYIENLDKLKLNNSVTSNKGDHSPLKKKEKEKEKENSVNQLQAKEKQRNLPLKQSGSFVITTRWETFE